MAFSPDGKTLAAGVTDGTVWWWNLAAPAHPSLVATITGPNGHVYSVAFSHSGQVVAAGSADGTVRLWDTSAAQAASAVCERRPAAQQVGLGDRRARDNLPRSVFLSLSEAVRDYAELPLTAWQTNKFFAAAGRPGGEIAGPL